jgi:hypothetical protein
MIKIGINRDGMMLRWDDGYEMGIHLCWGIRAGGGHEKISLCGNECNAYEFTVVWVVDSIDSSGERNNFHERSSLPMEEYKTRDSYMSLVAEGLHKIFIRAGRDDGEWEGYLLKKFSPFFDALDERFGDMVLNISLVTQVFEQPVYIPERDYEKVIREYERRPKAGKKEKAEEAA